MAGPRGYSSYRGRTPKGKIVLAIVLVMIILAAVVFLALQENLFYDENGNLQLDLPWQTDEEQPQEDEEILEELDITVQEAENKRLYAFSAASPLTQAGWEEARMDASLMSAPPYNAAAITMKDSAGKVYYDSGAALPKAVMVEEDTAAALAEAVGAESSHHMIARLACFLDPIAAKADVEGMGLKNTGGYIFYDGNNHNWLDPGKPAARQYLIALAEELAELGFDEILLTHVSYPTEGKINKIQYGGMDQAQSLQLFLEEMGEALKAYDVLLSLELPADVIAAGRDDIAGQVLTGLAPLVDRVYAPAAPDQIPVLGRAVTAAGGETDFVAELQEFSPEVSGDYSCLVLPEG